MPVVIILLPKTFVGIFRNVMSLFFLQNSNTPPLTGKPPQETRYKPISVFLSFFQSNIIWMHKDSRTFQAPFSIQHAYRPLYQMSGLGKKEMPSWRSSRHSWTLLPHSGHSKPGTPGRGKPRLAESKLGEITPGFVHKAQGIPKHFPPT